jgi:DNA-binding response OmpR family regulator
MSLIAIIDDDPDIVEALSAILTAKNYEVVAAKNAAEGEKIIAEHSPDLVILDVMMEEPDDGFFLAQNLRAKKFTKPIVMLTSVSKTVGFEFDAGEMAPVDKFLEKPISPQRLLAVIDELIAKGEKQ